MSTPNSILAKAFAPGSRVLVSASGGWRNDSYGFVSGEPEKIQTLQGEDLFYIVWFETPQHDLSEDGPYRKAQILSRFLSNA